MKLKWKSFLEPSFLACILLLGLAASLKGTIIKLTGASFEKLPIPLLNPFEELGESELLPFEAIHKSRIQNRDILESLGTEEYLQWTLLDPNQPIDSPVRYCSVFITYYTGNPDMVPHVPDECYVGGGNRRLSGEMIHIPVDFKTQAKFPQQSSPLIVSELQGITNIGAQYVVFSRMETTSLIPIEHKFSVQYFFKANDEYAASRTETRAILGKNFFNKYSYFSKVEWNFYGTDYSGRIYPDKQQTIEASQKLLSVLLPVLERDHWPDWENANQKTEFSEAN